MNGCRNQFVFVFLAVFTVAFFYTSYGTSAATVAELQTQINAKNDEIKKLEEDEKAYQAELANKSQQIKSLTSQISSLDSTIKGLNSSIRITETKISRTELEIEQLSIEISDKEDTIGKEHGNLASLTRSIQRSDAESVITQMMKYQSLAGFFDAVNGIFSVQESVQEYLTDVKKAKEDLDAKQSEAKTKQQELIQLSDQLADQRTLQQVQRTQRANILASTKNQEKLYQKLLADNQKRQAALQNEIDDFERQLKFIVDPSSLPTPGTGVLGWPLPNLVLSSCGSVKLTASMNCITQYFGNTPFAQSGAYSGKGHNGMDFRAGLGTPVLAAESGLVRGTGDTDLGCRGASYGKWVLLDHGDNLSTLYGHLSLIKVTEGQPVRRGDLIGYSGVSGYATGPHLHFGLFIKQAVEIQPLKSKVCGRNMILPIAAQNGYLNPLSYL